MAWEDVLAALTGGGQGLWGAHVNVQAQKRQQQIDEERRKQQEFDNGMRREALAQQRRQFARQERDDLRTDYSTMLGEMGAGAALNPEQVRGLEGVGMGHRIDRQGLQYEDVLGQQDLGFAAPLPSMTAAPQVAETGPEQQKRKALETQRQQDGAATMQRRAATRALPAHLQPAAQYGEATGKLPTFGADDFESPEQKQQRSFGAWLQQESVRHRNAVALQSQRDAADLRRAQMTRPPRPSNGGEKKAFGFFQRAYQAHQNLQSHEQEVQQMSGAEKLRLKAGDVPLLGNYLQSETGQKYTQAQRAFTEARLRKDSGAAIPSSEYENDARTYFAQPGDTPETIAQKAAAREAVLQGLAFESGAALHEYYGDDASGLYQTFGAPAGDDAEDAPAPQAPAPPQPRTAAEVLRTRPRTAPRKNPFRK